MPPRPRQTLIAALITGVHLLAGFGLTLFAWRVFDRAIGTAGEIILLSLLGTLIGQSVLIGLWVAFSAAAKVKRAFTALAVALVLSAQLQTAAHGWGHAGSSVFVLLWVCAPLCFVSAVATILRRRGVVLRRADEMSETPPREAIQFSIRQVLAVTFLVAVVLATVRGLRSLGPSLSLAVVVLVAVLLGIVFAAQTLACLWAALGLGRCWWRVPCALSLALAGGVLIGFAADTGWDEYAKMAGVAGWQAIVVIVTLMAIRSMGYRIFRVPRNADGGAT